MNGVPDCAYIYSILLVGYNVAHRTHVSPRYMFVESRDILWNKTSRFPNDLEVSQSCVASL